MASALPGSLRVNFHNVSLSSKISVHRDRDLKGHERANLIEVVLLVDGIKVYSAADSTTDKVVMNGPDRILKNTIRPGEIRVGLDVGRRDCRIIIQNPAPGEYRDRFIQGPILEELDLGGVTIRSGEWTGVNVGRRRKKMGLAGSELYVVR